jgi:hypothetical protein
LENNLTLHSNFKDTLTYNVDILLLGVILKDLFMCTQETNKNVFTHIFDRKM